MKFAHPQLLGLDSRHVEIDDRAWKSCIDPYYGKAYRLKPCIEEWLAEHQIDALFGESSRSLVYSTIHTLFFNDAKDAMLFKLAWL